MIQKLYTTILITWTWMYCSSTAIIKDPSNCVTYPCLIFQDEFNTFDHSVWHHINSAAATGNNEFQFYTNNRSNSFVRNGKLFLKPTLTNDTYDDDFLTSGTLDLWGTYTGNYCTSNRGNDGCYRKGSAESIINPIQSAAVRTDKSFSFKYGRMEVRAKCPRGDWIWPAVWLMPKYSAYGDWPASGEIDLLESRGNDVLTSQTDEDITPVGNQMVSQSLHWGPYVSQNGQPKTMGRKILKSGSFADDYHTFTLDWTSESLSLSIDKEETLNVTMTDKGFWELGGFSERLKDISNPWSSGSNLAPFDQEFYIIMNVAVGGTNQYFHENHVPKTPWDNNSPGGQARKDFWNARKEWLPSWKGDDTAFRIDYVKVWKLEN
ncbi:beta-1,3-glucan-binding protein-like [Hydractinia symbiolongicarpus]|uniref:beta-1,3-glucan-binding protein-like n=1 Tax=Hydractinia symbiolongicarpus TaxID=13093 RepID=UPI00254AD437|nr:beta-1,3-glucan-binding protein-like [Hydractinia symbiolongicarpus]